MDHSGVPSVQGCVDSYFMRIRTASHLMMGCAFCWELGPLHSTVSSAHRWSLYHGTVPVGPAALAAREVHDMRCTISFVDVLLRPELRPKPHTHTSGTRVYDHPPPPASRRWYSEHAHSAWPDPGQRPTLEETKRHAKGLRPIGKRKIGCTRAWIWICPCTTDSNIPDALSTFFPFRHIAGAIKEYFKRYREQIRKQGPQVRLKLRTVVLDVNVTEGWCLTRSRWVPA